MEDLKNAPAFYFEKPEMRLSPVRELSMEEAIVEKRELEEEEEEEEEKGGQHKWAEFCSEFAWKNIWFHGKDKVFRGWTDIGENLLIGLFFALLSIFDVGSDSWSAWRFIAVIFRSCIYPAEKASRASVSLRLYKLVLILLTQIVLCSGFGLVMTTQRPLHLKMIHMSLATSPIAQRSS